MRFQSVCEHLLQLESVRGACSREWVVVPNLIMRTEFDMSGYARLPVSPLHTPRRTSTPGFLLISFARVSGNQIFVWQDSDQSDGRMTGTEISSANVLRQEIREWVLGERLELPPSNSTVVMDHMRNGHSRSG